MSVSPDNPSQAKILPVDDEQQREWLRVTLGSIGDGVITTDAEGRVTFLNSVAESLTGWRQEQAAGRPLTEVFHIVNEMTRKTVENPVVKVIATGHVVGLANHTVLIAKDGKERAIDDSASPIRDSEGNVSGVVLVFRDVTERRQAERNARLLASIVENSDDAIIGKDVSGKITSWNRAAERLFGYSAAEAVGRPVAMLAPADRVDEMPAILARVKQGERVEHFDTVRRAKDGRLVPISLTVSPIKDDDGNVIGASKIARDISERKRAEETLREEKARLHTTLTSIGDAVIVTDAEGRVTLMNRVAEVLTGWADEAAGRPLEEVFRIVNEQTRQPVESPVTKVIREGVVVGLANHTSLIARDGTEVPIDDSGAPIRNAGGEIVGVVLVFRDVTERWRLERLQRDLQVELERQVRERTAELQASEERFRLLVEGTRDYAIFLLDPEGRVASWNPGAQRIKGYRADEIIGQHFSRFYPQEAIDQGWPGHELGVAATEGRFEDEGWRVRKDGSRFWANVIITALRDEAGNLHGFSKITRDLTERKRAETALQQANAELERRVEERTAALNAEREMLRVTLASIGDAVITTDTNGRVKLLNPVAETLTGWAQAQAEGQPLEAVFPILHEQTRRPVENPVAKVIREGVIVGLGNHTVLVARDGPERPIDDSAAPIRREDGQTVGVVLIFRDVTEQRQAHIALRQSEAEARRLLELNQAIVANMGEGLYTVDTQGLVTYMNPEAERLFGWTFEELRGRTMHDVTHHHYPDGRPFPIEDCAGFQVLHQGEVLKDYEDTFIRKDGSFFPVSYCSSPLRCEKKTVGLVVVFRDTIERKRAEQASRFLADASKSLAALVDYSSTMQKVARLAVPCFADWCAVDLVEPDGSLRRVAVAHVDPSRVELAHELNRRYPPHPDAPQGAPHIVRTGKPELISEITEAFLVEAVKDEELLRMVRELGLKSYLGVPLQTKGRTIGAITFVAAESARRFDATDLAVAEELAHRAGIAIENARLYSEVREADHRKDEFLALLAHELRNPLAPIRNALHIMKQGGADGAVVEQVREMMERQVHHMTRMVDDLLDVSRITRGKIELRKEVVDLASVVDRTMEALRPLIEDRRHELTVDLPPQLLRLEADPTRLEQVLANLLNNAAKYTNHGGHIWLTARQEGGELVLRVRDTGVGILPDMLPHIFEPFVQSDRVLHHSQGGLGIGLTLVRRLVEMHGGTVTAHSEGPGKGSEFTVRLPAFSPKQPLPGPKAAGEESPPVRAPKRRILVVDDNVDAAESLGLLLGMDGHEVRVAHDGPAALAAVEAERPDIVFLDIGMPVMNGYDVAQRLRQRPGLENLVLVAMTGWGQEEDRRRSHEAGFDHHLVKPANPDALRQLLARPR